MTTMPRSLKVEGDPTVFRWLRESSRRTIEDTAKRPKTNINLAEIIEKGERELIGKEIYPPVYELCKRRQRHFAKIAGSHNGN